MTFGLTVTGFNRKRLADIKSELEADYKAAFGDAVKLDGDSVLGQLIGVQAEREAELWELNEFLYHAAFPDSADGVSLDNVAAMVGVSRLPARFSEGEVTATGDPGTLLTSGRVISVAGTGDKFETLADATIGPGGTVVIAVRSQQTGPITAPSGTLTVIETPVSGWASVTNALDAETGRNIETDAELRIRRAQSLVIARGGTLAAIANRLRSLDGVVYADARENRTDVTDGNGLPPHSLEAFVITSTATNQEVGDLLWEIKPAGIQTHGAISVNVTDSFGNNQVVKFSGGQTVPIYLIVDLTTDAGYPVDGNDLVKAELIAYFATLANDDDVINWRLIAAIGEVPGITAVTIYQGTAPAPGSTANIAIAGNEIATLAAANISIV